MPEHGLDGLDVAPELIPGVVLCDGDREASQPGLRPAQWCTSRTWIAVPACRSRMIVIADLLGVLPRWDREQFRQWSTVLIRSNPARGDTGAVWRPQPGVCVFADLLAERRRARRDDFLADLALAEIGGRRLTDDELLGFCS